MKPVMFVSEGYHDNELSAHQPDNLPSLLAQKMNQRRKDEQESSNFLTARRRSSNPGLNMMQWNGYQIGEGLGIHSQGMFVPVKANMRSQSTGIGYTYNDCLKWISCMPIPELKRDPRVTTPSGRDPQRKDMTWVLKDKALNPRVTTPNDRDPQRKEMTWVPKDKARNPRVTTPNGRDPQRKDMTWVPKDIAGNPRVTTPNGRDLQRKDMTWVPKDKAGNPRVTTPNGRDPQRKDMTWVPMDKASMHKLCRNSSPDETLSARFLALEILEKNNVIWI